MSNNQNSSKKRLKMKEQKQKFDNIYGDFGESRVYEKFDNSYIWSKGELDFTQKDENINDSL